MPVEFGKGKKPPKKTKKTSTGTRRGKYRAVTKGDLIELIESVNKGDIPLTSAKDPDHLLARMQKGYSAEPFGGDEIRSGGWNSITYAVFHAILSSERFYIKEN